MLKDKRFVKIKGEKMCELTILMPCLNEAETLAICIRKAKQFLEINDIDGEILVSDNGSTDGSQAIAMAEGARIVSTDIRGYGSALINGCNNAQGRYVIMGDADDSYDFLALMPFLEKLRDGYDLVMGNRFEGGIERGAMPWTHRYIGNPILSFVGRLFFNSGIKDFHCGLRGYDRDAILQLHLHTTGMEYASEMVVMCELNKLKIAEVPTTLNKDGRSRPPHLRSMRDGWRHLKFLFMYAPNWLFLYPGIFLLAVGVLGGATLLMGQLKIFDVIFSIHTLLYCAFFMIIGFNIISMYVIVKLYAYDHDHIPHDISIDWNKKVKEDHLIFGGIALCVLGGMISCLALFIWKNTNYGQLEPEVVMRITIPAATMLEIGVQAIFFGFIVGILKIHKKDHSY